jgi:hypothetical protein
MTHTIQFASPTIVENVLATRTIQTHLLFMNLVLPFLFCRVFFIPAILECALTLDFFWSLLCVEFKFALEKLK